MLVLAVRARGMVGWLCRRGEDREAAGGREAERREGTSAEGEPVRAPHRQARKIAAASHPSPSPSLGRGSRISRYSIFLHWLPNRLSVEMCLVDIKVSGHSDEN